MADTNRKYEDWEIPSVATLFKALWAGIRFTTYLVICIAAELIGFVGCQLGNQSWDKPFNWVLRMKPFDDINFYLEENDEYSSIND